MLLFKITVPTMRLFGVYNLNVWRIFCKIESNCKKIENYYTFIYLQELNECIIKI